MNTAIPGSYSLEYWKIDTAGNISNSVSRTVSVTATGDTVAPVVAVTSHTNSDVVTGVPTLTGSVTDTG